METHQVRYFLAVCEDLNFTRAARRCGVSQPSLTDAIKRLEAELGGALFHRDQRGARLSDLGILLRPELASIDRSITQAALKAAKFRTERPVAPTHTDWRGFMRLHHAIAVAAIVLISFAVKTAVFPSHVAETGMSAVQAPGMNILQMHIDLANGNNLPDQKLRDMTFVFADGE